MVTGYAVSVNYRFFFDGLVRYGVPRKNPVPAREVAICKRLREFRQDLKISQAEFARQLGWEVSYLSNIEHGRAPLQFRLAHRIFDQFPINPVWLATGNGPRVVTAPIFLPFELDETFSGQFSEVFDEKLAPFVTERHTLAFYAEPDDRKKPGSRAEFYSLLCDEIRNWLASTPDDSLDHFCHFLMNEGDVLVSRYPKQPAKTVAARIREMEKFLARVEVIKRMDAVAAKREKKIY